ncbi:helix-turn-helix transcriptional regulator [Paenibacillus sp. FSL R7-0216]|uniref:helix-turn-helix transcriptional regulator n=1 Tax=Paenibacillus sp. FSL R7-0216 TaxID=2921677 RepID=UPI0030DCE277
MSIGLEYIVKLFNGNYSALAKRLDIKPQTVSDWIRGKRKISQTKLDELENLFKLKREFFQKELTESEKIEIDIEYLNRISKRDTISVPEIIYEDGNAYEIMRDYNPHENELRSKYEELAIQKLLLRIKAVLYNEGFSGEFIFDRHFSLLNDICSMLEKDDYIELDSEGIKPKESILEISAITKLVYLLDKRNKLAYGTRDESEFTLELEALLIKFNYLGEDTKLRREEDDSFFNNVE